MQVLFTDKQQLDINEAQALADSAETTCYELVQALLFTSDYRISGGTVNQVPAPNGTVTVDPGVFLKAGGFFYKLTATAVMNILTGTPNTPANIWGTGAAADATNPRKDIICVTYQKIADTPQSKTFINDSVSPPQPYTQTVNTRNESMPLFAVVHGAPSATPSEPAIPSGFVKLATVLVPANATTITDADITNNLNINVKTLEEIQFSTQPQSAFSDILHGMGVYASVNGTLATSETAPQSLAVNVANGAALLAGITVNYATETTVPLSAASFTHVPSEAISFATGDTQMFATNGAPPHQIRTGSVVISGRSEGTDYSVNYAAGTITRLASGGIPSGGAVVAQYDYFLPRIDLVQITFGANTINVVEGTPSQSPVAPAALTNSLAISQVFVGEGVTTISDANITDRRIYLSSVQEVADAHVSAESGTSASLKARLDAHEVRAVTSSVAVHGIKQGSGNSFDADTVDGINASATPAASKLVPLDASGRLQPMDGSQLTNLTVAEASRLRPSQQSSPNNTVLVLPGVFSSSDGSKTISFLGGSSPTFPAVTISGQGRTDLLVIDDTNALSIISGVQQVSPAPPTYPVGKLVLAEVTIINTSTVVIQNSAIKDVRNFLQAGQPQIDSASLEIADGTSGQDTTTGSGVKTNHLQNASVTLAKAASDLLAFITANGIPSGMIMPYAAGGSPPSGWVACDGTSYGRTQSGFANLFAAIGTSWGTIDGTHFNVPDLRGVVLRGISGSASDAFADPDTASRVARLAGGTSTGVGSFQQDGIASHIHSYGPQPIFPGGVTAGGFSGSSGQNPTANTNATGGNETRAKNAYVQYCIKL